jgi:hypothetical protein
VAYPPEYAELTPNHPLLARVSETTSGMMSPLPEKAFIKRRSGARRARDIWPLLAALALLLFPLDVALRRLMIEKEHLALFSDAFARLAWWRRIPVPAGAGAPLGRLLQRKRETVESIEEERAQTSIPQPGVAAEPPSPPAARPTVQRKPQPTPSVDPQERMKRLLEAKRRARPQ